MILDGTLIRHRRTELRLSQRALASQLGVTGAVVRGLETGANHADVSVGLLTRLSDALAVDPATLFLPRSEPPPGRAKDAAVLGAALHAAETLTPTTAITAALGWDRARIEAAIEQLDTQLRPAGLRVHRLNGQIGLTRAAEPLEARQLRSVVRAHLLRAGLGLTEARLLKTIATAGAPPRDLTNAQQVALGVLANAGLVELGPAPSPQAQRPWVIHPDVTYSTGIPDAPASTHAKERSRP